MQRTSWSVEEIKDQLSKDNVVEKGLMELYKRQTMSEQSTGYANNVNGIGFSKFDSEILSSFCERLEKGNHLTESQMKVAKKRILKYAKQLTEIANLKLADKVSQQSFKV